MNEKKEKELKRKSAKQEENGLSKVGGKKHDRTKFYL
ncbi:hypothetical protein C5S32_07785 [ANME-1 cluster archaeon GoMg1]|nr:hypothetical protein [ANME-1 cluster archaeon GoMg1]